MFRWLFLSGIYFFAGKSYGQDSPPLLTSFTVKPNKCITLHKGQLCYQKIRFNWKIKASQELCIFRVADQRAIICWKGEEKSLYEYKFSGAETEVFQLREKESQTSLAQVEVQVASVYRKNKKSSSGWRLF